MTWNPRLRLDNLSLHRTIAAEISGRPPNGCSKVLSRDALISSSHFTPCELTIGRLSRKFRPAILRVPMERVRSPGAEKKLSLKISNAISKQWGCCFFSCSSWSPCFFPKNPEVGPQGLKIEFIRMAHIPGTCGQTGIHSTSTEFGRYP